MSLRMASKMSSRTRLAARGLSLAIIPRCWLCPTQRQGAAQNPVRHSFGIALIEKFILTLAQAVKESLAVDRLHSTALNVIVAPIKHFADFCHFCQIPSQGIFHEVVGRAATLGGELSQTRLCLRLNVHFHDCQFRDVDWFCQSNCREKERPPVCLGRRLFSNPQPNPQSAMSCTTYA